MKRIFIYVIFIVGLLLLGLGLEAYRKWEYGYNGPLTQSSSTAGGMGSIEYPENNFTYVCANYPFTIAVYNNGFTIYGDNYGGNGTLVYLWIDVNGNNSFLSTTNLSFQLEYGLSYENSVPIPLQYNDSVAEYTAQFDVSPYWTLGYIRFALEVDSMLRESPDVLRFSLFYNPNIYIPFSVIFPVIGLISILFIEIYIRKSFQSRLENRRNKELLAILYQRNRAAYEESLRQLEEEHEKLLRQIESKDDN